MSKSDLNLVVVGGGTGSFTLLQELKVLTSNLTAVVNMCDDGGSTGILRDELGVLPPGDVRQCLVALSETPKMRDVFNYRFGDGIYKNQSLGNMILAGLELKYGSFAEAVKVASELLNITGSVVPVSLENYTLMMDDNGQIIQGEHHIDQHTINSKTPKLMLDPVARISSRAQRAFAAADIIVIAPGSLYSSVIPTLLVEGVSKAIQASQASKVLITNLVNKPGQTDGWHASDYATTVERYIGSDQLDYIIYNNELPDEELIAKYATAGESPVEADEGGLAAMHAQAIGASLTARKIHTQDPNDTILQRTLIRHDAIKVREILSKIAQGAL